MVLLKEVHLCYYGEASPQVMAYLLQEENPETVGPEGLIQAMEKFSAKELAERYAASPIHKFFVQERFQTAGRSAPSLNTNSSPRKSHPSSTKCRPYSSAIG